MIVLLCVTFSSLCILASGNNCSTTQHQMRCESTEVLNPCPDYCEFDKDCGRLMGGFKICPVPSVDFKCQPKCFCKPGLVRVETECEPVGKCCDINEEMIDCPGRCDEFCNSVPRSDCKVLDCFEKVCVCKKGFVRDFGHKCIPFEQCGEPFCQNSNSIYKTCGPSCEPTCDDRNPTCTEQCIRGCFCIDGYIRDKKGRCIKIENCPPRCSDDNQELREDVCDPTCDDPNPSCSEEVRERCFCKKGYVRDKSGNCIDPKMCPPKIPNCGKNQIWKTCFGGCDPVCGDLKRKCSACIDGCYCKDGYVRDRNFQCIKSENCPKPIRCEGINEEFSDCINECNTGTGTLAVSCGIACKSGCVCKKGFIRENGICIPRTSENTTPTHATPTTKASTTKKPESTTKNSKVVTKKPNPKQCGCFETYSNCVPEKEGTCQDHLVIQSKVCKSGCTCMPGYVRDKGKCIPAGNCYNRVKCE